MIRKDTFVNTYSGVPYYPAAPRSQDILITDVAHNLSQIVRFGGSMKPTWTVLQHSILCYLMARFLGLNLLDQKLALLHDTPEAYLGDMTRPLRKLLPQYDALYELNEKVHFKHFWLPWPMNERVAEIDDRVMLTEAFLLCNPDRPLETRWWLNRSRYNYDNYIEDKHTSKFFRENFDLISAFSVEEAKEEFLKHYNNLEAVSC